MSRRKPLPTTHLANKTRRSQQLPRSRFQKSSERRAISVRLVDSSPSQAWACACKALASACATLGLLHSKNNSLKAARDGVLLAAGVSNPEEAAQKRKMASRANSSSARPSSAKTNYDSADWTSSLLHTLTMRPLITKSQRSDRNKRMASRRGNYETMPRRARTAISISTGAPFNPTIIID